MWERSRKFTVSLNDLNKSQWEYWPSRGCLNGGEVKMCHQKWLNFLATVQFSIIFWVQTYLIDKLYPLYPFTEVFMKLVSRWIDLEKTIVRGKSSKPETRTRSVLVDSFDLLTHSQFSSDAKELDPYTIFFTLLTFSLSIHYLICMTQDPYILSNTIVNLNWQYLTIDDREKSLFKRQKVNSNSENPVTCKC